MPDASIPSWGRRLIGGATSVFAKFHSIPPLLTLPAVGLAAWFATPYAIKLAEGRSVAVTNPADPGGAGGTTTAPRTDPVAHTPAPKPSAPSSGGTAAAGVANILPRPVTASMIPSWLPLPAPVPVPASKLVPPRVVVQRPIPLAPRPKATARLVEPMPQQRLAERPVPRGGFDQRRTPGATAGARNSLLTGRSAAIGGGYMPRSPVSGGQQWHTDSFVSRGPFNAQPSFGGGYRSFGTGSFSNMRGGGGFGGFRGGGHR